MPFLPCSLGRLAQSPKPETWKSSAFDLRTRSLDSGASVFLCSLFSPCCAVSISVTSQCGSRGCPLVMPASVWPLQSAFPTTVSSLAKTTDSMVLFRCIRPFSGLSSLAQATQALEWCEAARAGATQGLRRV